MSDLHPRRPNVIAVIIMLVFAFALSTAAFAVSTVIAQHEHDSELDQARREVNGNQAMIFAVCRAFRRRDLFEQQRLDRAEKLELQYQKMTQPFSPLVKQYFHERRVAIVHNDATQREKFVNFDCIKGMERAYFQGYKSSSEPSGRPLPPETATKPLDTPIAKGNGP